MRSTQHDTRPAIAPARRSAQRGCGAVGARAARAALTSLSLLGVLASAGCLTTRYQTDTDPSSTEQLLLAESVDRVVAKLQLPDVEGRAVSLDVSAIEPKQTGYLQTALAARLGQEGARIVAPADAELHITALVGSVGTTSHGTSFGLPSIPVPPAGTPEIPFVSLVRQRGWARVRLLTWDQSGRLLSASPAVTDRARYDVLSILFLEFRSNDIYPGDYPTSQFDR